MSGAFGAYCYYDHGPLRPVAHTFSLWVVVVLAVAAGRPRRVAMTGGLVVLLAAVVAFYVGLKVMYGIRYPGMPYAINVDLLAEWGVFAVIAGVVLGWVFHWIGTPGWPGAAAAAAAIALLLGDVIRRGRMYPEDVPVPLFIACAGVVVVVLRLRGGGRAQAGRVALLTLPAVLLAFAVVSFPDWFEQLQLPG